jgi:hypothetical protein
MNGYGDEGLVVYFSFLHFLNASLSAGSTTLSDIAVGWLGEIASSARTRSTTLGTMVEHVLFNNSNLYGPQPF